MTQATHQTSGIRPYAVITGGSRGIGAEYARALAARGYNLFLVARDEARLEVVTRTLTARYRIDADYAVLDLSQPEAAQRLYTAARAHHAFTHLLINNAGFGLYGPFASLPLPQIQNMLRLHVDTVTESLRLFLPSMLEAQTGTIINVASVAGFFSIPYMAEYAATKAFLISFSEALAEEIRSSGVRIQVCCPGYTDTEFHRTAGVAPPHPLRAQSVQQVVAASLRALETGRVRVTVGWQGRLADLISRAVPRPWLVRLVGNHIRDRIMKVHP